MKTDHFLSLSLSLGVSLAILSEGQAFSMEIRTLTDFYDYYGTAFSLEEQTIIEGIFGNVEKYLEPDGLEIAIADGFIPFTREWKNHGTHWFNPSFVEPTNIQANPLLPAGLNIDQNGKLVGVFWAQELYQPITPLIQSLDLSSIDSATLTQLYGQYKQNIQPTPMIFDAFGDQAQWHTHKNVVIENLGAKNPQGNFDPKIMNFRQSLSDESLINELLIALNSEEIVLSPLESQPSLGYPAFNRGISPGFYMIHMWLGLGNKDGLFAGTNAAISVSPDAIYESQTFEDGSGGHDHGGGHDDDDQSPQSPSVPEPSSVISLLGLALFPLLKLLACFLPNFFEQGTPFKG